MKTFLYHENGWRMFQAERLPAKPDPKNYLYPGPLVSDIRAYEYEIAALKAKSIPVGNSHLIRQYLFDDIDPIEITNKKEFYEWPGDVEIQELESCGHPCEDYSDHCQYHGCSQDGKSVAILTLPKEQLP